MMLRRSMKRCSPSPKSEVKDCEKPASNSLKGKRRKLGTKQNDSKSAGNVKDNPKRSIKQLPVESSDSSSDEFMSGPPLSNFDLDELPVKKEITTSDFTAIENNILTGVTQLSDSENSDFEDVSEIKSAYIPPIKPVENVTERPGRKKKASNSSQSRIKSKHRNTLKTSTGSSNMKNSRMKVLPAPEVNQMDVSQLLALGEGLGTTSKAHTVATDRAHNSTSDSENNFSDWEDVQGLDIKPTEHTIPKDGVEVTLEMPDLYRKRKKKGFDMEAHLKRRLNRIKRELQVLIHKVHLLCWIAHGQYINSVLNSEVLMALSLSLIPSQHCYPSKHTNLKYLEQVVKWFKKTVTISDATENKPLLPLCESLQQSFQSHTVTSPRDLVFMFICILRALGVKARLILSLQPLPLKPSSQELCSVNKTSEKNASDIKKDVTIVKTEDTNMREVNEAMTSTKSSKEGKEWLEGKKSESTTESGRKLGNKKPEHAKCKKSIIKPSSSNLKSSTQNDKPAKKPRNYDDDDISHEKMDKLKRTLRTRKEVINKYKDKSDSSDEGGMPSTETRVACKKKRSPKSRIISDVHPLERCTADVSVIDKQKSSSRIQENRKDVKSVRVKANKRGKLSQTKTSVKLDTNSDSDFVPESSSSQKSFNVKTADSTDSNSESDFEPRKVTQKKKLTDGKVLQSNARTSVDRKGVQKEGKKKKNCCDVWTEVFMEEEEKWISVDIQYGKLHCVAELNSRATQPVTYVLAFNNDLTLKDVTCRYCAQFSTVTRKLRVEEKWWIASLSPFLTAPTAHDREEDEDLNRLILDRPLPTTFKELKNHPLYVLKDDLLKFEAIYPPDAPSLGFAKGKPIYARECVHVLHSREIWMKDAKVVRLGETPYKIVKARPKYDKMTGQVVKDLPLEIFGSWQVEDYIPPPAVNGKVPRNEYGNVELYKPCMLPKGTVHLQVPGLSRVARKLGIDCAPAVIGFDYNCGGSFPVLDGFVVCEEHQDTLLDAWNQEQDAAEKRQQEKLEKRVYGNWRRFIKGLLIRERLQKRYSFGDEAGPSEPKKIDNRKQSRKPIHSSSGQKNKQKVVHKRRKIESEDDDSDVDDNCSDKDWE